MQFVHIDVRVQTQQPHHPQYNIFYTPFADERRLERT